MCTISLYADRIGLGWAHDVFTLHITRSCILHAYVLLFTYSSYCELCWDFFDCLFHSLPLILFTLVMSMALKHKSTPAQNPLRSDASSSSDHAPLSLQFRDDDAYKAFLENFSRRGIHWSAESFWVILLTLTFPLSFTVRNRSLFVTSSSLVLLCWFRSSTPTCTGLTILYLISLLVSEVFLFLLHCSLLRMCLRFLV